VVAKVSTASTDISAIAPVVCNIKEEMQRRAPQCSLVKIAKEKNRVVRTLAQHALKSRSSKASFAYIP
jgi:hypothetical protein